LKQKDYSEDLSIYAPTEWKASNYILRFGKTDAEHFKGTSVEPRDNSLKENMPIIHPAQSQPQWLLIGDSHASMWAPVIDDIAMDMNKSIGYICQGGHLPLLNYAFADNTTSIDRIKHWKPELIIISLRWEVIPEHLIIKFMNEIANAYEQVVFIEQPPPLFFSDKSAPIVLANMGVKPSKHGRSYLHRQIRTRYKLGQDTLRKLVKLYPKSALIPIEGLYSRRGKVLVLKDKHVLYLDEDHLSYAGAKFAQAQLKKHLSEY
jgi:hypothetical protein